MNPANPYPHPSANLSSTHFQKVTNFPNSNIIPTSFPTILKLSSNNYNHSIPVTNYKFATPLALLPSIDKSDNVTRISFVCRYSSAHSPPTYPQCTQSSIEVCNCKQVQEKEPPEQRCSARNMNAQSTPTPTSLGTKNFNQLPSNAADPTSGLLLSCERSCPA